MLEPGEGIAGSCAASDVGLGNQLHERDPEAPLPGFEPGFPD
jgi:hypothetical protein